MLSHLLASFATLPDPRCAGRTRHRLLDILVIAVCAVVAGAETWVDIAYYGQLKQSWLATFLDLPGGIPSHDTFRRVFSLLDPQQVEQCFRQWMATVAPPLPREVVAVDGKTLRRSFDRGRAQGPLHVVSAFATEQGLSLGQVAVTGKGQELTAIPMLLSNLQLANTIVTLDALGCQQAIARQLVAQQADYILALKGNQGRYYRAVKAYCHTACCQRWVEYPADYDAFDHRHGRRVRRRAWVLPLGEELAGLRAWPGLQAIIVVETIRQVQHQPGTRAEWRYYLTSCPDAPAVLIQAIRRHWAIENSLHWVLDVVFREDEARSRDRVATRNFAVLRKLAFNLLQQGKHQPGSLRTRRRNAGWNDNYLTRLLTCARENNRAAAP
ncbi:ISAs1 family transposase [Hymenobacter mucosus]|uniref:Transposase, IS4 family n=1 Tax=Hymenobacter mucosus TaxID=1411120 RepID=A0A239BKA9_9BACT|nr:ISAs1 family transposase [Hymenobacter mucosus]SNS08657.1 transposase, IS4 family [Hymenobacter mucosus]